MLYNNHMNKTLAERLPRSTINKLIKRKISIKEVADALDCNPTYLGKVLKNLGVRINPGEIAAKRKAASDIRNARIKNFRAVAYQLNTKTITLAQALRHGSAATIYRYLKEVRDGAG